VLLLLDISQTHPVWQEQRKAALRKVELELDEADDIVYSSSDDAHKISYSLFFLGISIGS
jgi:hypothetical protein